MPELRGGGGQEAWRWKANTYYVRMHTIGVIEAPKEVEEDRQERQGERVPFGFAREIPRPPVEPILWEGDDA